MGREYVLVPPLPGFGAVAPTVAGRRPDDPCANVCGPDLYRRTR